MKAIDISEKVVGVPTKADGLTLKATDILVKAAGVPTKADGVTLKANEISEKAVGVPVKASSLSPFMFLAQADARTMLSVRRWSSSVGRPLQAALEARRLAIEIDEDKCNASDRDSDGSTFEYFLVAR